MTNTNFFGLHILYNSSFIHSRQVVSVGVSRYRGGGVKGVELSQKCNGVRVSQLIHMIYGGRTH